MTITCKPRILLLCLLIFLSSAVALRAEDISKEYQLKLAFIVNFARFITWPEESFSPENPQVTLCVLGKNPFGNALGDVDGKKVGERTLKVKNIETLNKEQQCHLLFAGQSEAASLAGLVARILNHQPVVTVSDSAGFAAAGGVIELVLKDDKLSFVINNTAMKERRVQASSSLLNLAASIR